MLFKLPTVVTRWVIVGAVGLSSRAQLETCKPYCEPAKVLAVSRQLAFADGAAWRPSDQCFAAQVSGSGTVGAFRRLADLPLPVTGGALTTRRCQTPSRRLHARPRGADGRVDPFSGSAALRAVHRQSAQTRPLTQQRVSPSGFSLLHSAAPPGVLTGSSARVTRRARAMSWLAAFTGSACS